MFALVGRRLTGNDRQVKKETIASLLGALIVGAIGGYTFSETRRPKIYYYASEVMSPPPMEDEDYNDPSQVMSIARGFEEELVRQKLKALLGDHTRIRIVWDGGGYQTKCMVEVWGASLGQKDFEDIIRQSGAEAGAKAEKLWAELVAEWKRRKADRTGPAQRP